MQWLALHYCFYLLALHYCFACSSLLLRFNTEMLVSFHLLLSVFACVQKHSFLNISKINFEGKLFCFTNKTKNVLFNKATLLNAQPKANH